MRLNSRIRNKGAEAGCAWKTIPVEHSRSVRTARPWKRQWKCWAGGVRGREHAWACSRLTEAFGGTGRGSLRAGPPLASGMWSPECPRGSSAHQQRLACPKPSMSGQDGTERAWEQTQASSPNAMSGGGQSPFQFPSRAEEHRGHSQEPEPPLKPPLGAPPVRPVVNPYQQANSDHTQFLGFLRTPCNSVIQKPLH